MVLWMMCITLSNNRCLGPVGLFNFCRVFFFFFPICMRTAVDLMSCIFSSIIQLFSFERKDKINVIYKIAIKLKT
jgi:hypothetical protein